MSTEAGLALAQAGDALSRGVEKLSASGHAKLSCLAASFRAVVGLCVL